MTKISLFLLLAASVAHADDTALIAAQVKAATVSGSAVTLPCRATSYSITTPIIIPKNLNNTSAKGIVRFLGENNSCVTLTAPNTFPKGRCLIEFDQTKTGRLLGAEIGGITFIEPNVDDVHSWCYRYSAANEPVTVTNVTNERAEGLYIHDNIYMGSNAFTHNHTILEGECFYCRIENNGQNNARGNPIKYETRMMKIDDCYWPSLPFNEACGFYGSILSNNTVVGNRGGYAAIFQGRLANSTLEYSFANGVRGGFLDSIGFDISNSWGAKVSHIGSEGLGDSPDVRVTNTSQSDFEYIGLGVPNDQGFGFGDGFQFINSSHNTLSHVSGSPYVQQAWEAISTATVPLGSLCKIRLDANSHSNTLKDIHFTGNSDVCSINLDNTVEDWK